MKRVLGFAATSLIAISVLVMLLEVGFRQADDRRAVMLSAVAAFVVQLSGFLAVRRVARKNVMAGWGTGIAIRFVAFLLWAVVGVAQFQLPLSAALLAMATFLFVTTLFEPLFLKS